jgi:hypothetical protein
MRSEPASISASGERPSTVYSSEETGKKYADGYADIGLCARGQPRRTEGRLQNRPRITSSADLGRSLAYAAALRVARFGTANEHVDWETALHVFTFANAIHQGLKRIEADESEQNGGIDATRGVLHGAMAVYLARYLNVPPARLPGEDGDRLDDLPDDVAGLREALLEAFDRQRQVDAAGRLVARHLMLGHPPNALVAALAEGLLREDAVFHAYQMLEAGVRQFGEWGNTDPGRHILIGVARYLAAHSPTERAVFQTADIAERLLRGGELHQDS